MSHAMWQFKIHMQCFSTHPHHDRYVVLGQGFHAEISGVAITKIRLRTRITTVRILYFGVEPNDFKFLCFQSHQSEILVMM